MLAGDALLTIAFEIVSRTKPARRYNISALLREISVAAGSQKLIAGQVADLEAEGKTSNATSCSLSMRIKLQPF